MLLALCLALSLGQVDLSALNLTPAAAPVQRGSLLYVPLEAGGITVVETAASPPVVVRTVLEGRFISRLALEGDRLLAFEAREEVVSLSLADPTTPRLARGLPSSRGPGVSMPAAPARPTLSPTAPGPTPTATATVTEVIDGRVIFDGGVSQGFRRGLRVRISSQRLVTKPDLVTGQPVQTPSGEVTGVLAIEQADEKRAMAMLGRGDIAEKGDLVELTTEPVTERLLFPRRAPFEWRFGFVVRPFLGLEGMTKPVGLQIDAYATWYPTALPLSITVAAAPFGFVINGREPHYPGTFLALAAYATDYFEIGLGAGALIGNLGPCSSLPGLPSDCEVNTGFTINQSLRLGAIDGFHLSWSSSIFSRPTQFVFGVGRGEISIPLTSRLGLFGAGGGGENGWAMGELGVRTALGGAGAPGTVMLRASLGYSAIFDGPTRETVGGPAVSFGMEWRR